MTPVPDILMAFERIGLKEVENTGQLRRIETKFLLPLHSLPVFLEEMQHTIRY
jgi:hypothetical protein